VIHTQKIDLIFRKTGLNAHFKKVKHTQIIVIYIVNKVHFYAKLTLFKQSSPIYNNSNFIIFLTLFKQSLLFMNKVNFD